MFVMLPLMFMATAYAAYLAIAKPRTFALFLLPAGLLAFNSEADSSGSGLASLSSVWLFLLIVLCLIAMVGLRGTRIGMSAPEICYLIFLCWCVLEAPRARHFDFAIRAFLKLLYPFLSMWLVRRAIASPELAAKLIQLQFRATFTLALLNWGAMVIPVIYWFILPIFWGGAGFLDHGAMIAMLALACWKIRRNYKAVLLAILMALTSFYAVNRTTVMAYAIGCSVFCIVEFRKIAVLVIPGFYLAAGMILLTVPAFREKMFYHPDAVDTGTMLTTSAVTNQEFNNNGRFTMWEKVLDKFFWPHPAMGSGLGSTQAWFYTGEAKEAGCGIIKIEHSEYVKLLADTGIIGLSLFALTLILGIFQAIGAYHHATEPLTHTFATAAICAIPVFMACMATDNALLYVLPAAQFPMALAGIASRLATSRKPTTIQAVYIKPVDALWLPRRAIGQRLADPRAIQSKTASVSSIA